MKNGPVRLAVARAARERLTLLAASFPHLRGEGGPDNSAAWESVLREEETMANTVQVAFRLDERLVARVDAYAVQLGHDQPGLTFTRADAVRLLLTRALDEASKNAPQRPSVPHG